MYKNIGEYYIEDNTRKPSIDFQSNLSESKIIYEVMRVINNEILFLEDHLNRLENSLSQSGMNISISEIRENLLKLVCLHPDLNRNIKLDVYNHHYRLYFMESSYPDEISYHRGVTTITSRITRTDPSIKQLNMTYKKHIQEIKGDAFEVLLINDAGYVIEGSRSNLLFIKDDCIYTPPLEEILEGVTYKNVLRIAKDLGCQVVYQSIHYDQVSDMDACFLTGTSLGVLPISLINHIKFRSSKHSIVLALIEAYNNNR